MNGVFMTRIDYEALVERLNEAHKTIDDLKEDLGFWKKEATLHSDARVQLLDEIKELEYDYQSMKDSYETVRVNLGLE
jgi:hypothetical protein